MGAPDARVQSGKVVEVTGFDTATGSDIPVPFSDVSQKRPNEFTMTSLSADGSRLGFTCTQ